MAKILTGVHRNSTFRNLLGAIIPAIQLSNDPKMNHSFSLPIPLHQIKNGHYCGQTPIAQQQLGWLVD
jgi:tryptophanyl-tRNA synthetase